MYDKKLIKKLKAGDKESFNEVFESHYSLYFSFAYAILKDKDTAKDILQEVFLKLYLHRSELDENKSVHSWLLRAIRFSILNYLRLHCNSRKESAVDTEEMGPRDENPYSEIFYSDTRSALMKAIEKLPPRRREVFTMSRMKNMSNDEIAEATSLSVRTVEKHLELALKDIRKTLS